jgi:ABC-2 type transport system permease protein
MRIKALALRILTQIRHDKRTLGLVLIAPLLILTIIYFIFNTSASTFSIGVVDVPTTVVERITGNEDLTITVTEYTSAEARDAVDDEKAIAVLDMSGTTPIIYLDGTDAASAGKLTGLLKSAVMLDSITTVRDVLNNLKESLPPALLGNIVLPALPDVESATDNWKVDYVYGNADSTFFDNFGAPMVGIIVFFLTFLIAGINFLSERTSGTLEKLLSTPIKRGEIIAGYTLGFGILAVIQSLLVTLFVVYVLGMQVVGSIWLVILINLLTAITALTLGILLSTLANSEFQMIQFIPIVILPQIFLCGLFDLSGGWVIVSYFMPLYYTTDALTEVMLRGHGIESIYLDLLVLSGLSLIFVMVNTLMLKRHRGV